MTLRRITRAAWFCAALLFVAALVQSAIRAREFNAWKFFNGDVA